MYQVGFIGCGNMGSAIASAVAKTIDPEQILLSDQLSSKSEELAGTLGACVGTNEEVAQKCTYIFLAVKPQMMGEMLKPLAEILKGRGDDFVLVTIAAGLSIGDIAEMTDACCPIIRIMPNTPVAVGQGMILACASPDVKQETFDEFLRLMQASGKVDAIPEEWIDAAGALSGCGPAFVYLFLDALADGAASCGLPKERALSYACQTAIGAASMIRETGRDPKDLTDAVCSPGGTTIEGVHALEDGDMRGTVMQAVKAAYDRTSELRK